MMMNMCAEYVRVLYEHDFFPLHVLHKGARQLTTLSTRHWKIRHFANSPLGQLITLPIRHSVNSPLALSRERNISESDQIGCKHCSAIVFRVIKYNKLFVLSLSIIGILVTNLSLLYLIWGRP